MAFLTQRILQSAFRLPATIRATELRAEPDVVVLPVREGQTPSEKLPVRIFLGTETAQYKAERVFIWSIEKVRDPARVYEIYLMKHLSGYRPRFWLTGFTNYRFAIPHYAGNTGRAIYNDVDQIYLKDPAEMFDLEMGEHAYLSIDAGDTSVALYDCEKMSKLWTLKDAQTGSKNPLHARASGVPGQWGILDRKWNARDRDYVPGESGVLHYTALHRQPWHPFPKLFAYQANPVANVWFDLEQSANEAGYQVFSAARPSRDFTDLCRGLQSGQTKALPNSNGSRATPATGEGGLFELLRQCKVRTVLDCRISTLASEPSLSLPPALASELEPLVAYDPTHSANTLTECVDGVVCLEMLEFVPDEDVPWLLERLFSHGKHLLYCGVDESPRNTAGVAPVRRRQRTAAWWQYQFEIVARHHPGVRWRLRLQRKNANHDKSAPIIEGNECNNPDVVVWVVANQKPGHTSQATALAEIIGWPYQVKRVAQSPFAFMRVLLRLHFGHITPLQAPWPNVIVACGWWPTRVARWIKHRSGGRIRLLLAGRKCGPARNPTDILISCQHFRLPNHERRIETLLPVQPVSASRIDAARERGQELMANSAGPRVALLVGGSSKQHTLSPVDAALLGRDVLEQVRSIGGSLFAVTSRRTGNKASAALEASLRGNAQVHRWSPDAQDNPYLAYLAAADILVVTGESESMLTDAIATGKSVYIYPLQQRRYGPWLGLGEKLAEWSQRRPKNRRGTERPQQGFEYLCSRILELEWVLPPRDIDGLHRSLVENHLAKMFNKSLTVSDSGKTIDPENLGRRLRIMLAQPQDDRVTQEASPYSGNVTIEA